MLIIIALVVLLATMIIGLPIPLAFLASAGSICLFGGYDTSFLMVYGYNKINTILLLTIPLFVLAGAIIVKGGIGEKLIGTVEKYVGNVTPPTAPLLYLAGRISGAEVKDMLGPDLALICFAWLPTLLRIKAAKYCLKLSWIRHLTQQV